MTTWPTMGRVMNDRHQGLRERRAPARGSPAGAPHGVVSGSRATAGSTAASGSAACPSASSSGHTVTFLPSCHWNMHHLVGDLEAVRVHLVVAEDRPRLQLAAARSRTLSRVQRAGAPDASA